MFSQLSAKIAAIVLLVGPGVALIGYSLYLIWAGDFTDETSNILFNLTGVALIGYFLYRLYGRISKRKSYLLIAFFVVVIGTILFGGNLIHSAKADEVATPPEIVNGSGTMCVVTNENVDKITEFYKTWDDDAYRLWVLTHSHLCFGVEYDTAFPMGSIGDAFTVGDGSGLCIVPFAWRVSGVHVPVFDMLTVAPESCQ